MQNVSLKVTSLKQRFLNYYAANELVVSASVFVAGFLFDLLTLGRIDDLFGLLQQAVYLFILGTLLVCEIRVKTGTLVIPEKYQKAWTYHDLIVHFFFGSLLSVYTIFYYTSASALTSFFFILLLAGLMLANEFPKIQALGVPVRVILFNICVLSFFSFVYPIIIGHVGLLPFWLGLLTSAGVMALIWKINFKEQGSRLLIQHVLVPSLVIHALFVVGYFTSLIPPVPVAVKKIGVYYDVEKTDGKYLGKHLRPYWKFWANGSQDFSARTGDKVFILLSIFSPGRFEDKVYLRWFYDHPKLGWHLEDSIPLSILGGRDEGFRGFGSKQFYTPGDWRVIVETSDGREVGRISLSITQDPTSEVREFQTDTF